MISGNTYNNYSNSSSSSSTTTTNNNISSITPAQLQAAAAADKEDLKRHVLNTLGPLYMTYHGIQSYKYAPARLGFIYLDPLVLLSSPR